jgi:hypothetical protein
MFLPQIVYKARLTGQGFMQRAAEFLSVFAALRANKFHVREEY